jgi:glycerol-3-phosphate dehydrogenase (NAD(P)+)
MDKVVEEGLKPLLKRKIVSSTAGFRGRYWIKDLRLGLFYANQADHRVYPLKAEENVTVVNAGAFGYTLAVHLGRKFDENPDYSDHGLILYDARPGLVEAIAEERQHPTFFKGHTLPKVVHVESDLKSAVRRADLVLIATPSNYFRETVKALLDANPDPFDLLIATKGFEVETALLPVEVVWEELEKRIRKDDIRLAVISGANLADEIIDGQITATQLAAENEELALNLRGLLETPNFIVHLSRDLVGTQLAAAMKNVYAIAYGISSGSKEVSVNFTSTLVTRISAEIKRLAVAMGADEETFGPEGQAWMADFLATAQGGRNSQFGRSLTKWSAPFALRRFKEEKKNVEGYSAVGAAVRLSEKYDVRLPIVEVLADILYEGGEVDPRQFLEEGR